MVYRFDQIEIVCAWLPVCHTCSPTRGGLDAVGGVQGAKHAEQAVIITSQSSDMLVFWVILEILMHIFHAVLSVCFPVPVRF